MTLAQFSSLMKKVGTCGQHVHLFNFWSKVNNFMELGTNMMPHSQHFSASYNKYRQHSKSKAKVDLSLYMPWRHKREMRYSSTCSNHGIIWRTVVRLMPQCCIPSERVSYTHWIGGWMGSGVSVDIEEWKNLMLLPGIKPWSSGA